MWLETPMENTAEGIDEVRKVVDRYTDAGIFVAPSSFSPPSMSHADRDSALKW